MATNFVGKSNVVFTQEKATVATGGTASNAVNIAGWTLGAIQVPTTFDGTTFRLQTSTDNGQGAGTWEDLYLDGAGSVTLCQITPGGTGRVILLNTFAAAISNVHTIRILCDTTQTTTPTVFTLILKRAL